MRFGILAVLIILGIIIAYFLQQRKPDPPSSPSYRAPAQLDPKDFQLSHNQYHFILFSSEKCDSCAEVWNYLSGLDLDNLSSLKIVIEDNESLVSRYKIDGVPTTLLIDSSGEVLGSFFGPLNNDTITEFLATQNL